MTFLKVQLQIAGAPTVHYTYVATLFYQMAYSTQNHVVDLSLPVQNDALLITVDINKSTTCTYIPCQIPKEELIKLLPKSWVTNYEKFHQSLVPVQSVEPSFKRNLDGMVDITFKRIATLESSSPGLFSTPINMISPIAYQDVPIPSFDNDGRPVYAFKEGSHNFWDICTCLDYLQTKDEVDRPSRKKEEVDQAKI